MTTGFGNDLKSTFGRFLQMPGRQVTVEIMPRQRLADTRNGLQNIGKARVNGSHG